MLRPHFIPSYSLLNVVSHDPVTFDVIFNTLQGCPFLTFISISEPSLHTLPSTQPDRYPDNEDECICHY
jgi:hypothetical protein